VLGKGSAGGGGANVPWRSGSLIARSPLLIKAANRGTERGRAFVVVVYNKERKRLKDVLQQK